MADISKVTLLNGSTYDIKDATARTQITSEAATRKAADDSINNTINDLKSNLTGAMHYVGETTTPIADGMSVSYTRLEGLEDTTAITINGNEYYPKSGDVVIYQNKEFIATVSYIGKTKNVLWNEFGSTGSLKALAFKDSASGSVTPSGTVSTPTFTGTAHDIYIPIYIKDIRNGIKLDSTNWERDSNTGEYKDPHVGNVDNMLVNVKPKVTITRSGSVVLRKTIGTVKQVSTVGTLPTFSANVNDENLSFSFNAGSLPTTSDVYVVTKVDPVYTDPVVEVNPFTIASYDFTQTILVHTNYTPQGTISQPTFTGNASNVTVK